MNNDELALALRDLGAHLDLGRADVVGAVLSGLDEPGRADRCRRHVDRPRLLAAAVVIVVVMVGLLAVTPSREAIADWLGIGGVRITRTDRPRPPGTSVTAGSSPITSIEDVEGQVTFDVLGAGAELAGPPVAVSVDPRVESGLIEIRYRDFTLVELASAPGESPPLEKIVDPGTTVERVTVGGHRGFWLSGDPHQIGFVGVDGKLDTDSVRQAGDVLVWEDGGVTYRIEGLPTLEQALAIAASLR